MTIAQILRNKGSAVFTIHARATLGEALRAMCEQHIGALLVSDGEVAVAGIVTERDVLRRFNASPGDCKGLPVKEIMTPREKLIVGNPGDEIDYLMSVMTSNRIRHVPIVDNEGQLCGMVSIGDVIKSLLSEREYQLRHLQDYISSSYPA